MTSTAHAELPSKHLITTCTNTKISDRSFFSFSSNLHQEVFYPEDFVMDSDDSPIVKEHYLPSNVYVY